MPGDPQNPIPVENAIPVSPQEPILDAPLPPTASEPTDSASVAPEAPREVESAVVVKDANSGLTPLDPTDTPSANPAPNGTDEPKAEPVFEPIKAPETQTAQIPVIEPFAKRSLLARAREMIQFRKRKKLDKIMTLFLKQSKITNDEVEKLLHVSDATATRYLSILEKEGKIQQVGKTGKGVLYSKL